MAEYIERKADSDALTCRECKYSKDINRKKFVWCMKHDGGVRGNDCCSFGVRRAE